MTTIEALKAEVSDLSVAVNMRRALIASTRGWKRAALIADQEKTQEAIRAAQRQIIAIEAR